MLLNFFVPMIVDNNTVKELTGIIIAATKGEIIPRNTAKTERVL